MYSDVSICELFDATIKVRKFDGSKKKPGGFSKELNFIFWMYTRILLTLLITRSVPFSMSYTCLTF